MRPEVTPLASVSKGQAGASLNHTSAGEAGLKAAPFPWPLPRKERKEQPSAPTSALAPGEAVGRVPL